MSHSGLYSGLYSRVREYGELLDEVILRLKVGKSVPSDPRRKRLADLLIAAGRGDAKSLASQVFAVLVHADEAGNPRELSALGDALLSRDVEPTLVERLENIALAIEHERSDLLSKMRGRGV